MKKIAILGGSFNPIHNGHLQIAEDSLNEFGFEKIIFIPNSNPPHRKIDGFSYEQRIEIIEKSISDNKNFEISLVERDNTKIHYTYNTVLENFVSKEVQPYFIMGDDEFFKIESWYNWEELLQICKIVVFLRNHSREYIVEEKREIIEKYGALILENSVISISSSDIRKRLESKKSIKYLVEKNALDRINYFYKINEIKKDLESKLSKNRYEHSLRVADYSKKLAKIYGENEDKAYLTALLHDCAKGLEEEYILQNVCDFDIIEKNREEFYLLHSIIGREVANKIYGIEDEEILNAIEYHTTARAKMSMIEKIVFIADKIEPNREYEEVENLRKFANENIDLAIVKFLENSFSFREKRNEKAHILSYEAYEYLLNNGVL